MKKTKLCPYCKSIIDKNATWCYACGKILPKTKVFVRVLIGIVVICFIACFLIITNSMSEYKEEIESMQQETESKENEIADVQKEMNESEYKSLCQEYNYKDVLRNPEQYIGEKIVVTLEISTVKQESWTNPTKYYFAYSESEPGSGFFYGDRYAVFDERKNQDELKILEDDIIKVWGEISEPQETTSLIVNGEELFCIDMKYVELISE